MLGGGYLLCRSEIENIRQEKYADIATIARMKLGQIMQWRAECLSDAQRAANGPRVITLLTELAKKPDAAVLRTEVKGLLEVNRKGDLYADVILVSPDGKILLAARDDAAPVDPATRQTIAAALASRNPVLSDFFRLADGGIYIDAAAAVPDAGGRPLAVMLLRSNAKSRLYPLIQSWPTQSRSAETLLVRWQGEEIILLNELRHRSQTALSMREPLAMTALPAVQAVLGKQGMVQGKDYRGEEVLADLRPLPGLPWFLVTKVDTREVLTEAHYRVRTIAGMTGLLILLAAFVTAFVRRQQQAGFFRGLYQSERQKWEAQEEFRTVLYSIGDAVITTDVEGRVRQMNPVAETLTGWSHAEARGKPLEQVFRIINEETRAKVNNPVQRVLRDGVVVGLANHTLLLARDGAEHPIADSAAPIRNEGNVDITGVIMVFRDQTAERAAQRAQQESEQRFRALIENNYDAISLRAADGTVLYDSPAVFRITGYTPAERLGRNALAFVHPDDRRETEQKFAELMRQPGAVAVCQARFVHKDGSLRVIESVRTNLLHDPAVRAVVTNFRDITERQQMAEALQKSEQRFRALIENSQDAIILLAADGTILYDSPSLFRILGYAPEERLGRKAYDFVCPEDRRKLEQSFFELVPRTGAVDSYEARYLHKDGTPLAVEVVRTNLLHDPAVQAVVINFRDITKRRQAEKELRENEAKLSLALHASQMGVWELDIAGDRRMFDDQVCSLLGLDPARFTGSEAEFFAVVHPDDRDKIKQMRNTSIAQGVPYDADYRVVRPDGSIRYIRARGNLVRDEEGKPLKINGVIWDTTERWQGEKEQEKLQAQLVQAQKMESVGRLAGGVAHDFNNMLMVILGNAELCQDTVEPAHPGYTALEEIIKGANHAQSLTSQLLAFARKQPIAPHVLDLNATISNMLNLLRRLIGEDVMIIWQPDAALWPVTLDPSQIDQILTNLIINARDAIQGTGTITIETRNTTLDQPYCDLHAGATPGNYVLLTVSDTGCGMDRETLAHIFEPFFTTKAFGKGTGLGLSMVYGIVKQNNGFISVYSEPGQGTQFKIYWPYVLGENAHPAIGHAPAAAVGGDETILLVEDEEAVRAIARNFLSSLGYTVLAAEDPEKALRLAAEHPGEIQLLLTDVIMPGMNGRDLAQRLSEIRPSMKRLFISGFTADVLTQRGILADGLNFLGKPFTRDKLARKVREALTA